MGAGRHASAVFVSMRYVKLIGILRAKRRRAGFLLRFDVAHNAPDHGRWDATVAEQPLVVGSIGAEGQRDGTAHGLIAELPSARQKLSGEGVSEPLVGVERRGEL